MTPEQRELAEDHLSAEARSLLRGLTADLGVPFHTWPRLDALATVFTTLAGLRLAAHLRRARGLSPTESLQVASQQLGYARSTLPKRVDTWRARAGEEA